MTIWALHGFLGLPADFDELKSHLIQDHPQWDWNSLDCLRIRELSPSNSINEWGKSFCRWVDSRAKSGPQVLVGYSQGGRLALQALREQPQKWKAVILISANPGLQTESEKATRLKSDQEWADQFLNSNFEKVLKKWNSQAVFQGSQNEPKRKEADYNRRQLADSLLQWSLAHQEDHRDFLSQVTVPVLYVAGENDPKYCQIGQTLQNSNPKIQFQMIEKSGHRVLFDQPSQLASAISNFIKD